MLIAPAGNATWCVGPSGSHIKLEESGSVSLTGLDLADYPFHPEHARRERERSMPPEVRARLDEMAKEHEELMSEWDRLRALGLSQDEANARLLEQELERDRIEGGD